MIFCDTHCHLDFDDFDKDREAVLERAQKAGLAFLINPGIDLASSEAACSLAASWPKLVYAACGFHPHDSSGFDPEISLSQLEYLAGNPGVVAIGEIGLDYYRDRSPRPVQRQVFAAQLELAVKLDLPVILHNREADADMLAMLLDWHASLPAESRLAQDPGVLHAYAGSLPMAQALAPMGFCFGIGGPLTYANADERRRITAGIPLNRLLLETDAPFLTPQPNRGKRNEPAYIPVIAEVLADLHQKSAEEIGAVTTANAKRLFRLA